MRSREDMLDSRDPSDPAIPDASPETPRRRSFCAVVAFHYVRVKKKPLTASDALIWRKTRQMGRKACPQIFFLTLNRSAPQ